MAPFDHEAHKKWYKYTTSVITSLSWDPTTETHTPFRATTKHVHRTWARTHSSTPALYIQPETTQELELVIHLARHNHKRITVVGSGHSPSTLTCQKDWIVNLDNYSKVLHVDKERLQITVQAGIRLYQLQNELQKLGWSMKNIGSIMDQSIAGAIATGTHGSSLDHGLLSESVVGLAIMLADGRVADANQYENGDLFEAALVSLGSLGIVTEVTFQAVPAFKLAWTQQVLLLDKMLSNWEKIWTTSEYCRVWWFPYSERTIYWKADRSDALELKERPKSWYGSWFGYHAYQIALYFASWFPRLTPLVERWVFALQYGWEEGTTGSAVEKSHEALAMDCLFSQYVNEWAIPLYKGPEFITRFQAWLMHDDATARIPFPSKGIYVHAPIEVRVTNTSISRTPRPWLDPSDPQGPSLYINATLYRPYYTDFPGMVTYYKAFEYLMKEMGGRPHWAKNFISVTKEDVWGMYPRLGDWVALRNSVDPEGIFVSDWLKELILPDEQPIDEKEGGYGQWTPEEGEMDQSRLGESMGSFEFVSEGKVIRTPLSGSVESLY
ncbi:L-gulonolactone/D-arabinono-1,4-lactone oxidase [Ascobolus immersus RN42]|uniref:D-arabinono-1,4-lactone oxidase n=1 Tax=Ascobolus immersus RN42 TaxID=1160509 RepID=A0A3N4IGX6_ASCIM|nr:L-gulonolactone/D-arabinono-1,4-lactone oxidase [Ascobolus immersus RN42]